MKVYVVARLPRIVRVPRIDIQLQKELPVIFPDRAQAQKACDGLNEMKRKDDPGFIVEEREETEKPSGNST